MWPKEDYQEHMLGYLDGMRIEFERHVHFHFQHLDLNEFYTSLDTVFECLWQLIGASELDWEGYRSPLETRCDELLRAFDQLFDTHYWMSSGAPLRSINAFIRYPSAIRGEPA